MQVRFGTSWSTIFLIHEKCNFPQEIRIVDQSGEVLEEFRKPAAGAVGSDQLKQPKSKET